ncbi:hypothetical protein OJF2_12620 [Aquisphaera giovannonii]|uniref:Uncharacterized protein n=1 Tax=Aquisphaera giovannonii TaxID=406548 RepID=A0A5B9VXZ8_9BACT|nr:hypothetical protein OJF2_12620 [Aquisphaera giovannonii]
MPGQGFPVVSAISQPAAGRRASVPGRRHRMPRESSRRVTPRRHDGLTSLPSSRRFAPANPRHPDALAASVAWLRSSPRRASNASPQILSMEPLEHGFRTGSPASPRDRSISLGGACRSARPCSRVAAVEPQATPRDRLGVRTAPGSPRRPTPAGSPAAPPRPPRPLGRPSSRSARPWVGAASTASSGEERPGPSTLRVVGTDSRAFGPGSSSPTPSSPPVRLAGASPSAPRRCPPSRPGGGPTRRARRFENLAASPFVSMP